MNWMYLCYYVQTQGEQIQRYMHAWRIWGILRRLTFSTSGQSRCLTGLKHSWVHFQIDFNSYPYNCWLLNDLVMNPDELKKTDEKENNEWYMQVWIHWLKLMHCQLWMIKSPYCSMMERGCHWPLKSGASNECDKKKSPLYLMKTVCGCLQCLLQIALPSEFYTGMVFYWYW